MNNTAELNERAMITMAQAEKLTGLARSTLIRFAEAGYFATDANERGEQLLALDEICSLFNIDRPANADALITQPIRPELTGTNLSTAQIVPEIGRTSADFAGGTFVNTAPNKSSKVVELPRSHKLTESAPVPTQPEIQTLAPNLAANIVVAPDKKQSPLATDHSQELRRLQNIIRGQEHEILKLQKVIELQEQLLETRENEIRDHKKQRRWLQERVEKQDLKSERDQLLLISEMQMLTKMYLQQHNRKSLVIQALEWLGFKNPQPNLQAEQHTRLNYQDLKK